MVKASNLAFYKRSGEKWKDEDLHAINLYMGYASKSETYGLDCNINPHAKWVYNMDQDEDDMANWTRQAPGADTDEGRSFMPMAFEDIFEPPRKLKTFKVKDYT